MQLPSASLSQVPPEVQRYLSGPQAESRQFDFLLGEWRADATRFRSDGSVLLTYQATWHAQALDGGRMIMDELNVLSAAGVPVSSFVTLRTYSGVTERWEMVGLGAFQPSSISEWHGQFKDGQALLLAAGKSPDGKSVKTAIRFFDIKDDSFRWENSISWDDGAT